MKQQLLYTVSAATKENNKNTNGSTLLSKQALELVPSIINRVLEEYQLFVGIVADNGHLVQLSEASLN